MSPEERQLISGLFDRIRSAANSPRDPEAETLIGDAVKAMPYAPYFLAQAVIVQDQALRAANERLQELESRLNEFEQQGQRPGDFLGGLGSIFGGAAPPAQPSTQPRSPWGPPEQQPYPQQPAPGAWSGPHAGGGFLRGAFGTAAGVAGGVLLADSIRGLFGGNSGGLGIGSGLGGFGGRGGETIVNNYYDDTPGADAAGSGTTVVDDYDDSDSDDVGSGGDDGTYDV
jgi:uncharacterized protein